METLAPAKRRALRAKAHHLHPVVSIGHHGLTPAVLHELDVNLLAHELIKVRVFSDLRDERDAMLQRICAALGAAPVQHIGKLLVLWRAATCSRTAAAQGRAASRERATCARTCAGRTAGQAPAGGASRTEDDGQVDSASPPSPYADGTHDRATAPRPRRRTAACCEAAGRPCPPPPRRQLNLFNLRRYAWAPSRSSPSS